MKKAFHRPIYHFLPPANWMNDPNGLIQFEGTYHIFYQYNPNAPLPRNMHWGHATSQDLIHWQHEPIALTPTPNSADEDGCWSGCAFLVDGVPAVMYTGRKAELERPCLAFSKNNLQTWEKYPGNPVISDLPAELNLTDFRDHKIWFENEKWYQVIGAGIRDKCGAVLLYESQDLKNWKYLKVLARGDEIINQKIYAGTVWECPDFFSLNNHHVLLISVAKIGVNGWKGFYPVYFSGRYQGQEFRIKHESRLDYGEASFYAPQTFLDEKGRRLMFGWILEDCSEEDNIKAGWAGVMSLPRQMCVLPSGELACSPPAELENLRGAQTHLEDLQIEPSTTNPFEGLKAQNAELRFLLEPSADCLFELEMFASAEGDEKTRLCYDPDNCRFILDRSFSSSSENVNKQNAYLPLDFEDKKLDLHLYLDGSVLEINLNGKLFLTSRVYPQKENSSLLGLKVTQGSLKVHSFDLWQMTSIWA